MKWHYPVGLLYDLFSGAEPIYPPNGERGRTAAQAGHGEKSKEENDIEVLPWRLVVHFTEWPEDQLVKLDAERKVLQDAFINGVKEVDYFSRGTSTKLIESSRQIFFGMAPRRS